MKSTVNRAGLALGMLFAAMHLLWVIAVALGWGQSLLAASFRYHFIETSNTVGTADAGTALVGIVLAFVSGYIVGGVFAWLFVCFQKK